MDAGHGHHPLPEEGGHLARTSGSGGAGRAQWGRAGPPGRAWQALLESHDGRHRARGFPGSPAGLLAEDPPRGRRFPTCRGTQSSCPVAAASPPRVGHELFFHFYTGTNRNDKTLSDEVRTGTDKPWKILFPQITGGVSTQSRQEGRWGLRGCGAGVCGGRSRCPFAGMRGPCPALAASLAVDVEQLLLDPRGCRARGSDGLASSPHMAEPSR